MRRQARTVAVWAYLVSALAVSAQAPSDETRAAIRAEVQAALRATKAPEQVRRETVEAFRAKVRSARAEIAEACRAEGGTWVVLFNGGGTWFGCMGR